MTEEDYKREVEYWRNAAIYLADCHAATAYEYERKSVSKSKRNRMISIMTTCIAVMGKQPSKAGDHPRDPQDIIDRCDSVRSRLMEAAK